MCQNKMNGEGVSIVTNIKGYLPIFAPYLNLASSLLEIIPQKNKVTRIALIAVVRKVGHCNQIWGHLDIFLDTAEDANGISKAVEIVMVEEDNGSGGKALFFYIGYKNLCLDPSSEFKTENIDEAKRRALEILGLF